MKKVFSTFAALLMMLTFIPAQAQQHNCWGINPGNGIIEKDYCWFDTLCSIVVIDTSNHSNIWQNGEPSKSIFTSSYSLPRAMVTDTLNTYPDNNASYFDLIIPLTNNTF